MTNNKEELRRRNKDSAHDSAMFWIQLANDRQSGITQQLLGLALVLLPLSASLIIANIYLSPSEKTLLIISWIMFLVSIPSGFWQILTDSNYFVKLSRDSSKREELWSNTERDFNEIDKDVEALGNVSPSSSDWALKLQMITVFAGLLFLAVIGISLISQQRQVKINPSHKFFQTIKSHH